MKSCRALLFFFLLFRLLPAAAQRDSLALDTAAFLGQDTLAVVADTAAARDTFLLLTLVVKPMRFDTVAMSGNPFIGFRNPMRLRESVHQATGKEALFYCAAGLLLLFAIARNVFGRYLHDLFRVFFRANLKQRHAKDQVQTPVPSLVMNLLFFASAGLFVVLLFRRAGLGGGISFWPLLGYTAAGLAALYLGKFIALWLLGWIFRVPAAIESYTFIIFTANKILGMVLLPFTVLLAFAGELLAQVALTLGLIITGGVLAYRYFLSYVTVQRQVRLGFLHFLLYLAAFEVAPLLLINKLLFRYLG